MNWEAIGAVGEIVGALAVVVSLVYLALQIRLSNLAARESSMQALMQETSTFLGRLSSSKDNAGVWFKGLTDSPDLDDFEIGQFSILCLELTINWERVFYLKKKVDIDNHMVHIVEQNRRRVIQSPGFRRWYKSAQGDFTLEFRELLEIEMESDANYEPVIERWK